VNWTQLEDRVLRPFDDVALRGAAKKLLIEAQEDFIRETRCLDRWKWLYIVASSDYVALPDDFLELLRVEWKGRRLYSADKSKFGTLHKTDTTWHFGTPSEYFENYGRLYLVPGTSAADWLTLWYIYRPNVLTDSATAYSTLGYDALTAHFVKGETVTGGTSGATGVVEFDDNERKTGTLTLSSITYNNTITGTTIAFVDSDPDTITDSGNGFVTAGFVAGQRIKVSGTVSNDGYYTIDTVAAGTITLVAADELTAEAAGTSFTIEAVFTDNEALTGSSNGAATENGVESVLTTAGDDPDIEENYRKYLVDYAKAAIFDDKGDARALRFEQRYLGAREMVRQHFASRMRTGAGQIIDVMGGPIE